MKLLFENKDEIHPQPKVPSLCYIKNVITNPNIIVGDYTYYDDVCSGGEDFEKHVTHFYPHLGDKLIIGKFCSIAKGVEFIMNPCYCKTSYQNFHSNTHFHGLRFIC